MVILILLPAQNQEYTHSKYENEKNPPKSCLANFGQQNFAQVAAKKRGKNESGYVHPHTSFQVLVF